MVQQHLEDAELGHVIGHGRFVRGGLGLVDGQQGHPSWLLERGHSGHSVYWRDTCDFTAMVVSESRELGSDIAGIGDKP